MTDFLIAELDDRLEFGVAIVDDDTLQYDNEPTCKNSGTCCGTNISCDNTSNCKAPCCS